METKKTKVIRAVIVILIPALAGLIGMVFWENKNRVEGQVSISGDDFQILDTVECFTLSDDRDVIRVNCESISQGIRLRSAVYFGCIYRFTIRHGDTVIHPEIYYHKTTLGRGPEQWNMRFAFHETDGTWDVRVYGERSGLPESGLICHDVEKNGIRIEFWEEDGTVTEYR